MKVLHVNTERTWRGGEQQVLYLLQGLARLGVPQELLCQPGGVLRRRAEECGLAVWPRRMRGELDLGAMVAIARRIRRQGIDVVHMHTSHAHTLGVLGAALAGAPRAVTIVARRVDFSIHKRRWPDLSLWKYTRGVDRIVCVSERIRRVLLDDGLPASLLEVVHSGVDLGRFDDVPDRASDTRREFGIPDGAPVIGTVGHCADHKGQRDLVAAAPAVLRRVPEARFLVVGDGELLPALREQARALGVAERVHFPGFRADVLALIRCFDVFCFPSRLEGLGTSVLDALALRRPVVATRAGGIPEMIEDGVHGLLVEPASPEPLADALCWMLAHPDRARAMGDAGRARVEAEFSVERTVERTLAVYERLSARR